MSSSQARRRLAQLGGVFAAAVVIAGCGNNYRPVVTPVNSSGPPAQPQSYAVVVAAPPASSGGFSTAAIIDYSGDSVMVSGVPIAASSGVVPLAFTVDEIGGTGYSYNSDHTITNFPISTTLQQKNELVTTLSSGAQPINIAAPASGLWIGDLVPPGVSGNAVDLFSGSPQTFKLAIPMSPATTPVFVAGSPSAGGQREYVINQNIPGTPTGMECTLTPTAVVNNGTAVPVEIANETADAAIPLDPFAAFVPTSSPSTLGLCPVFAVQSPDQRRLFVLNRGSDTITVINSQNNSLDECVPFLNENGQPVTCHPVLPLSLNAVSALTKANTASCSSKLPGAPCLSLTAPPNGTVGMTPTAGPVYAEFNQATNQLVVANYGAGTISIIDVSLDQYGNDSPTFGTTYTVPVGNNPASVTVLFDGSRAYTANQTDGTVTVVDLSSHTVEKTLAVVGHPRTVVSTQNSLFGKVYVASPDSTSLTIIQTTTDLVDTTVLLQGNIVDVRATTQNGGSQTVGTYNGSASISNINSSSRIPGFGQPCNLPPNILTAAYGSSYTFDECRQQSIP